jgi:hypothetical protein
MENPPTAFLISPKQEANYLFQLDQDENWWPALLNQYLASPDASLQELWHTILDKPEEWSAIVSAAKADGMKPARLLAIQDSAGWGRRLTPLLTDPAHQKLIELFLKSLVMLKTKRVNDIGTRGKTRQHINGILAAMGSDALTALEHLQYAESHLVSASPQNPPMRPDTRLYYETRQKESLDLLTNLLAVYLLFKYSRSVEDIRQVQGIIDERLVKPYLQKAAATSDPREGAAWKTTASSYQQLMRAVEINFE